MRKGYSGSALRALGVVCGAFVTGMALDAIVSRSQALAAAMAPVIRVTAQKYRYVPDEITLVRGQPAVLEFLAVDAVHGFSLPELGVRADLLPGQRVRVALTPSRPGTFLFHCDNFCGSGHEDMTGFVHVIDAADGTVTPAPSAAPRSDGPGTSGMGEGPVAERALPVLSVLQRTVFGPHCAICHSGTGTELPTAMDLSSAEASARALIGVESRELPGQLRVSPGDPAHSLLLRKVEGSAPMPGARMPLAGPYLDAEAVDAIRTWIRDGASSSR